MLADIVNACFEAGGSIAVWGNVRAIYRAKRTEGVSFPAMFFFAAFGAWNMFYYPHLGQWASFGGGMLLAIGEVAYVILMLRYRRRG